MKCGPMKGCGAVYNKDVAKSGVLELAARMEDIGADLKRFEDSKDHTILFDAHKKYMTLPITWQVDWAVADMDSEAMQKIADSLRERINEHLQTTGSNAIPVPRAFNAQ
mmetsp:Transcript_1774/g.4029  ORF Transcript_1774/g.4029 Transcript_1774/m.4029 type:complete len:109 (-) Transcript_1774:157-483(-)